MTEYFIIKNPFKRLNNDKQVNPVPLNVSFLLPELGIFSRSHIRYKHVFSIMTKWKRGGGGHLLTVIMHWKQKRLFDPTETFILLIGADCSNPEELT